MQTLTQRGLVASALALLAGSASAQFTDLGPGQATGVSADGTVVSGSNGGGAFRWTPAGGIVNLPTASTAVGISLDGNTLTGEFGGNAGLWTQASGWVDLGGVPTSGGGCPNLSSPYAVNGDGTVAVGLAWDTCASAFGFKWTSAGGMEALPTLGPNSSRANAVSNDGLVIGGWDEAANGTRRAKLWFDDGTQLLPLEGEPNNPDGAGEVWGFNSDGSVVVGGSFEGAFRWTAAGGVEQLGTLFPGAGATAYAVSEDGKIVVGSSGSFFTGTAAFIWIEGQGMMNLVDYATDQGVTLPPGTAFGFALDMTPDGKTIVGQAGVFPFSTGFVLTLPGIDAYGTGASSANVLELTATGGNAPGGTITLTTSNLDASSTQVLTGLSQGCATLPLIGGVILIDLATLEPPLLTSAVVGGTATRNVGVPLDASLIGVVGYLQSVARDDSQPGGWALSNGLRIVICAPAP